ncbi:MAG TPA: hypothetical protein VMU05_15730 [Dongiaceae bacterium]|nr:hypothetical protein [Dongiaceae bacterium]
MRELRNSEAGFIASLRGEERARYYWWYRKYIRVRRITVILQASQALFLIALFAARTLAPAILRIWPVVFLVFVGLGIWTAFLECPRCGQTFHMNNRYAPGDECSNCGLTLRQLSAIARPRETVSRDC